MATATPRHWQGVFTGIVLLVFCGSWVTQAQTLAWVTSGEEAIQLATQQGKRVLLVAGRDNCAECEYQRHTVCELAEPNIAQWILDNYIPWYCNIDLTKEWTTYATGLGGFSLPLVCCIDPKSPGVYLSRKTGLQMPNPFFTWLQSYTQLALPIIQAPIFGVHQVVLPFSGLAVGTTITIERALAPSGPWIPVASFSAQSAATNWVDDSPLARQAFYRAKAAR